MPMSRGWTELEIEGVRSLIATVALALTLLDPDADFVRRLSRWRRWLRILGAPR